jgi:hypothetical protein
MLAHSLTVGSFVTSPKPLANTKYSGRMPLAAGRCCHAATVQFLSRFPGRRGGELGEDRPQLLGALTGGLLLGDALGVQAA